MALIKTPFRLVSAGTVVPPIEPPVAGSFEIGAVQIGAGDVASGTVEMTLSAYVKQGTSAVLEYSTNADFSNSVTSENLTLNGANFVKKDLSGLPTDTLIYYRLKSGNVVGFSSAVKTPRARGQGCKFGISSCAGKDQPDRTSNHLVFSRIPELHPDLDVFCHLGDKFYADHTQNIPQLFRDSHIAAISKSNTIQFYSKQSVEEIYNDHDFGLNNSHGDRPEAPAARQVFREIVPHRPLLRSRVTGIARNNENAAGRAWTCGDVRFIMTDTRGAKKVSSDPAIKTIWGQLQRDWILEELVNAIEPVIMFMFGEPLISNVSDLAPQAEKDAVRVFPFGGTYSEPTTIDSSDNFFAYPDERRWLSNIMMNEAYRKKGKLLNDRTVYGYGDAHGMQLDDGSNSQYADGFIGKYIEGDTRTVVKGPPCICSGSLDSNTSYKGYPNEVDGKIMMVSVRGGYGYYDLVPNGATLDLTFTGYQIHPTTGAQTICSNVNGQMILKKSFTNQYYD